MGFTSVDAFQKLIWITLFLEINQIFVIPVDPNIGVRSPGPLDFLGGQLVLGFEFHLLFTFEVASPGPLDLNGSNMVHGKPVIFEKSPGQGHLIGRLNQGGTEISQTLIFIFVHHIKRRGQKLLPQVLCCRQVSSDLTDALINQPNIIWDLAPSVGVLIIYHLLLQLKLLQHHINPGHLLDHVLILHLLLWLSILHVVPMSLRHNRGLNLQLLPLLLEALLMVVGDQHTCLTPLLIEVPADGPLDLDRGQVLGRHGTRPRLLNNTLYT
jgi:hypothetical protein